MAYPMVFILKIILRYRPRRRRLLCLRRFLFYRHLLFLNRRLCRFLHLLRLLRHQHSLYRFYLLFHMKIVVPKIFKGLLRLRGFRQVKPLIY